jgi:hypothetical protein
MVVHFSGDMSADDGVGSPEAAKPREQFLSEAAAGSIAGPRSQRTGSAIPTRAGAGNATGCIVGPGLLTRWFI